MKAQHAVFDTRVPSGHSPPLVAGAAREIAARATKARKDANAIDESVESSKASARERTWMV
jgi:hypothetical protein